MVHPSKVIWMKMEMEITIPMMNYDGDKTHYNVGEEN